MLDEIKVTKMETQIQEQRKTVDFDTREFTIEFLVQKYLSKIDTDENDIFVPDYQREFVWDDERQSRLIESIILGLPIPVIFLAEGRNGRLEIVDGSQRIRTLSAYLSDELTLEELEKLTELNGTKYSDLPQSRKRKINNTPIRMIVLSDSATEQVKNDLFERINRGSDLLRNMEKRKGIYQGAFNKFIYEQCAKHPLMNKLAPLAKAVEKRQEHEELILRFFALTDTYPAFTTHKRGIGVALDEYLEKMNRISTPESLKEKFSEFEKMLKFVDATFKSGFSKNPGQGVSRVFFEAVSVGSHLALKENSNLSTQGKIKGYELLKDYNFKNLVSGKYKTHTPDKMRQRIEFIKDKIMELQN